VCQRRAAHHRVALFVDEIVHYARPRSRMRARISARERQRKSAVSSRERPCPTPQQMSRSSISLHGVSMLRCGGSDSVMPDRQRASGQQKGRLRKGTGHGLSLVSEVHTIVRSTRLTRSAHRRLQRSNCRAGLRLAIQCPQAGEHGENACVHREVDEHLVHRMSPYANFIGNTIDAGSGPGNATGVAPPGGTLSFSCVFRIANKV
jgi:hypothetical protein